ncbi:malate synthase A [Demequina sp. SYSU T00039]|uniref:Malate synthase n=1 Tax=Demequina lignilytica TaxID=3051663 RepID=A0AAW7M0H6_9MICO|nr:MULTISPECIES: malate synthase A [unclassified Demequina]MDN4486624.1 malate synthase A [Demequina sp. SYSU T00039]MDN4489310.1 malate synthase A [Demequina sp. SYSU T00068]
MCHTTITTNAPMGPRYAEILSPEALDFIATLHRQLAGERADLLQARHARQEAIAAGADLGFLAETAAVRDDPHWRVAGPGPGLEDRRVEITGPTDRKMTINALNSGARVWLADHEDANTPTFANMVEGQLNLRDAIRREISYTSPDGKEYTLGETTPTIVFRPRGWHLASRHLMHVDEHGNRFACSASMVDAGLYLFHNAKELIARGSGPYLYLPKIEGHREARLWDHLFTLAEQELGLEHGTIRATVLIETLPAAFEMEEILYELRDHCAGLNAGRWDYIFSIIKTYRERGDEHVLPDRAQITMTVPFMRAYTELLVSTCHRRGAQAIGGMSAFIPNRRDPEATEKALAQVAADKRREASDGFDGSWVAHPGLVAVAQAEFDAVLGDRPNQLDRQRSEVSVTAADLLDTTVPGGRITLAGVRANVSAALRYLESWLRGVGAAGIDNLMEDVATAEISRSQLWQWIRTGATTSEGIPVTRELVAQMLAETMSTVERPDGELFDQAAALLAEACLEEAYPSFVTLPGCTRYLTDRVPVAA